MALDLADVARRAAELGGEEAVASVTLRRELVVQVGPDGAAMPPRRTFDLLIRLMVRDGAGRVGVARCTTGTTNEALQLLGELAHRQAAAARLDFRPFPEVLGGLAHDGFDPATAELDPAQAAAIARESAAGIGMGLGRDRIASWTSEVVELAVARSGGDSARDRRTGVCLTAQSVDGDGRLTGYGQASAPATSMIDAAAVARAATPLDLRLDRWGGPRFASPGDPVVLLAPAVAPLLEHLARIACTGHAHATGMSPFTGRLGARVAPGSVSLFDAPRLAGTLARSIDIEGVPCVPVPLIQAGLARRVLHDSASAAEAGTRSTGHAAELGGTPAGPAPRNLVLDGGTVASVGELAAPLQQSVVIGMVEHARTDGPGSTRFSAIGRAAYRVEGGQPSKLLGDVLITGDLVELLASVEALTTDTELVAALHRLPERTRATSCPAVRARGLSVFAT